MNQYKFVAELSKLLGFMSSWDRQAVIEQYTAVFDEAEDVDVLIAKLGSPTRLAISLARDYVPTEPPKVEEAAPAGAEAPAGEEGAEVPENVNGENESLPLEEIVEQQPEESGEEPQAALEEAPVPVPAAAEEEALPAEPAPMKSGRKARPVALVFYILAALIVGLPVAVVAIALGVPFLVLGACVVALAIWAALTVIGMLSMISDILLTLGAALAAAAVGLLLAWLGLWISLELGYLWIGKVIFRLGSKLCFKKEVPENG